MKRKRLFLAVCLILTFRIALADSFPDESSYRFIHAKALKSAMARGEKITVVDVRSDFAYRMEHIKGAISLPLDRLPQDIALNPLPRTGKIVTYCSCPRHLAQMGFDLLKKAGYSNMFVLYEGLPGWKEAAYPLEGSLANRPVRAYWVIGHVLDAHRKPRAGAVVRVLQPATEQLEITNTDKRGFYAIPLRFYGLKPGDQLEVAFMAASTGGDVIFFQVGPYQSPWGMQVDDTGAHVEPFPELFLRTFKIKKLKNKN